MGTEEAAVRRDERVVLEPASPTRPRGELPGAYGAPGPLQGDAGAMYTRELAARKEEPSI